jgi:hypothetical protein
LREALARTDRDFVVTQSPRPRRSSAAGRGKSAARLAWLRPLRRNPGQTAACIALAGVWIGILLNALLFQDGRHSAPFFAASPVPAAAAIPVPPPRPVLAASAPATAPAAGLSDQGVKAQRTAIPIPAAAPAVALPSQAVTPVPPPRDPISDLLRAGPAAEPSKPVLAAQRQLNKLNYGPVRPDGLFGLGTRQAIEKFEKDRKLPVTGELNVRTTRELAAAAAAAGE